MARGTNDAWSVRSTLVVARLAHIEYILVATPVRSRGEQATGRVECECQCERRKNMEKREGEREEESEEKREGERSTPRARTGASTHPLAFVSSRVPETSDAAADCAGVGGPPWCPTCNAGSSHSSSHSHSPRSPPQPGPSGSSVEAISILRVEEHSCTEGRVSLQKSARVNALH
jgi:hypothetical protein